MYNKISRVAPVVLSKEQIALKLISLPHWKIENSKLVREPIEVRDFETACSLFNAIAMRSHLWGHHPELTLNYNRLGIKLTTHDIGNQVSDIDLKLAKRIEKYVDMYKFEEGVAEEK
ncbi:hypothetical protein Kpol_1056p14 [Vanderwaltozyma polyspora DSM 70294]|uniref:4a-hydroxytetrahydrobiopterin dehydratase n=1 Tax=Vanderwaltozyma polyspora (strain ATCC 22028 / DSM 70294 / BCRC 21397 / CBS 2163 / NBRC 10782 / NRRL Y-8283 / UCD 57-17) TaxID=436907 RepID=A7TLM1_VANPO|nr:uncharacterized protein Kpol_1056p14 [Vanderwaltozyma polyspora DSM 70294]EDO16813.1 hypothetical protein Kpol_1056p14 [Vanderwaltozyma polyspora DSM 70294]